MRFTTRGALVLASCAFLVSYLILVAFQLDQIAALPDFMAFYSIAHAIAAGGLAASQHMYSLRFQVASEAFLDHGLGRAYVEPFVDLPPAAWVVIPFTILSIWPAFYLWDAIGLGLCLIGTFWLVRQERLGADAIPLALTIVASYPTYAALASGQYDLLWPLCLALFTSAWYCTSAWGRWTRTALASFLFAFKPDLLLLLVVPAIAAWRQRLVRDSIACLAVLAAITVAVVGVSGLLVLPHLEAYTLFYRFPPGSDETWLGLLWRFTGHGELTQALAWASIGTALLALSWAWWLNPPATPRDWKLALTSTVCLSLFVAPHSLNHDLVLLVGPAVWAAAALKDSGRGLGWLAFWIVLMNVALIVDASRPLSPITFPVVPFVLLAAAVASWRARRTLAVAAAPRPSRAGAEPEAGAAS
ncbi:MAG: hypothetical protein WB867_00805 [Candidatus Dormiibacterota bacterium]